jgi:hypothetical protein
MKQPKTPVEAARELSLRLWDFAEIYQDSFQAARCLSYYHNLNQEINRLNAQEKQKKINLLNTLADTLLGRSSSCEPKKSDYPLIEIYSLEKYLLESARSRRPFRHLADDKKALELFEKLYYQDMIFFYPFLRQLAEDIYEHDLSVEDLKDFITYNRYPMTSPDKDFVQRVIMYCERYRVKIPTAMFAEKYAMTKIADSYYRIETAEKQVFEAAKDFYLKESNKLQIQASQLLSELAAL